MSETLEARLLEAFEMHSPEQIQACLDEGASALEPIKGKSPIDCLIEFYPRTPRFAACLETMFAAGARIEDPLLRAVLLDDPAQLPDDWARRLSLECTYTSLADVTALHICAEYNSVRCARALLDRGADVDARAGIDEHGIGGHTPLFHCVNSNRNHCRPMMELLVEAGASLEIRLRGLVWARNFDWETTVFDVTPISYAQCGLYAQFHRREQDVYSNIDYLYRKRWQGAPAPYRNVPNKYLQS